MARGQRLGQRRDLDALGQPVEARRLADEVAVDEREPSAVEPAKRRAPASGRAGVLGGRRPAAKGAASRSSGAQVGVLELLHPPMRQAALGEDAEGVLARCARSPGSLLFAASKAWTRPVSAGVCMRVMAAMALTPPPLAVIGVAVRLELERQLLAARPHDAAVRHHVHACPARCG